jgi:hypothetical protein
MFSLRGTKPGNLAFIYFFIAYDVLTASPCLMPLTVGTGYGVQTVLKVLR